MRAIAVLFSILFLLIGGLLVAPNFIDLNQYKAQIIQGVKTASGYDILIDGDISAALLPYPHAKVENISVLSPNPQKFDTILKLDNAYVSVALAPLMQGKVEVSNVNLVRPSISLERTKDGQPAWVISKPQKQVDAHEAQEMEAGIQAPPIAFNTISIEEGRIQYFDGKSESEQILENINVSIKVQDIQNGPFSVQGDWDYNGLGIEFSGGTALIENGSTEAQVDLILDGAALSFSGPVSLQEPYTAQGKTSLNISDFDALVRAFQVQAPDIKVIKAEGVVSADINSMEVKDLVLHYGQSQGSGSVSFKNFQTLPIQIQTNLAISGDDLKPFSSARINLDTFINDQEVSVRKGTVTLDQSTVGIAASYKFSDTKPVLDLSLSSDNLDLDNLQNKVSGGSQGGSGNQSGGDVTQAMQSFALPFDALFGVDFKKARIQGYDIENLVLQGEARDSEIVISKASIGNLGGLKANVSGRINNVQALSGIDFKLSASTNNIAQTMQAFDLKADQIPQNVKQARVDATVKGEVKVLDISSQIKAAGGTLDIQGLARNVSEAPEFADLLLGLKHPNLEKAIQIVAPDFAGGPSLQKPVDIAAKLSQSGQKYGVSDIRGTLGKTTLSGSVDVDMGQSKPKVVADLNLGNVVLEAAQASAGGASRASNSGNNAALSSRWSKAPIDTSGLNAVNADIKIAAQSLQYARWNFSKPQTNIALNNGTLSIQDMQAGLFGGQATINATVQGGQSLTVQSEADFDNVDAQKLVSALSGSNRLKAQGTLSLESDIKTAGNSQHALVSALNGNALLQGRDVILQGVDLARVARGLSENERIGSSVTSILGGATNSGQTQFDTIDGSYVINQGVVNISSMVMDGPAASITSKGNANLPTWYLDTTHDIALKNAGDFEPFTITISGPLDNPANTFGRGIFQDYLNRKIQRKIGRELEGTGVGRALQQFGILPGQDTQSVQPEETAPASGQNIQPSEQQQQQEDQEVEPEQVIRGVLDGLLR